MLVGLLAAVIEDGAAVGSMASADPTRDAQAIYTMTLGTMEAHLFARTAPTRSETAHLVGFALRALSS